MVVKSPRTTRGLGHTAQLSTAMGSFCWARLAQPKDWPQVSVQSHLAERVPVKGKEDMGYGRIVLKWGFPEMGLPQARWTVYFMEHPIYKWMITRG